MPTTKDFEVGDRVRYVGPGPDFGAEGTVRGIDRDMGEAGVEMNGDDYTTWYPLKQLKPID